MATGTNEPQPIDDRPPIQPVAGQPKKKLTLLEQVLKMTAKVLPQSRYGYLDAATVIALADARLVHGGRTTQVWDAEVAHEATGKVLALFRCTQVVLYRRLA